MKNKNRISLILIAILALSMVLAGCGAEKAPEATEPVMNGEEFIPTDDPGITLKTPYFTFHYPTELQGEVEIREKGEGEKHTVTFLTEVAGQETELFSVILSKAEETQGYLIGTLEDETAGKIYAYILMNENWLDSWTEEELNAFSAKQERVNDLIMQLHEDESFKPGK